MAAGQLDAAVTEAGGRSAHPVTKLSSAAASRARQGFMMQLAWNASGRKERWQGMWIFVLEAGVALGLLLFIVWWTWPRSEKKDEGERK